MLETPQIRQTRIQLTACVHVTVPRAQIREVMGPGLSEVRTAIAAQGLVATGAWLTHHFRMSPDVFDFEICVPVAGPIAVAGRVRPGQLPAMKVAQAIYRGSYEGLGAAWPEFDAWITTNGHRPAADLWECYLTGPDSSPDSSGWRTELTRPLLD